MMFWIGTFPLTFIKHTDSFRSRHITELFLREFGSSMRTAAPNARGIILLASATSKQALHPNLHLLHTFQEVVNLKPPNKDARKEVHSLYDVIGVVIMAAEMAHRFSCIL